MDGMMTGREVADLLHVHQNTIRRWATEGHIKCYRLSTRGDLRFKREDIAEFISKRQVLMLSVVELKGC